MSCGVWEQNETKRPTVFNTKEVMSQNQKKYCLEKRRNQAEKAKEISNKSFIQGERLLVCSLPILRRVFPTSSCQGFAKKSFPKEKGTERERKMERIEKNFAWKSRDTRHRKCKKRESQTTLPIGERNRGETEREKTRLISPLYRGAKTLPFLAKIRRGEGESEGPSSSESMLKIWYWHRIELNL